jgi:hypothetical protein
VIPTPASLYRRLREFGAEDPIFDAIILAGPLLIILFALIGRNPVSLALAGMYLLLVVIRVVQNALVAAEDES